MRINYLRLLLLTLFSQHSAFTTTTSRKSMMPSKQLIIVSLPEDKYYKNSLQAIAAFAKELAAKADNNDDVIILFPKKFIEKAKRKQSGSSNCTTADAVGGFDVGNASVLAVDDSIDLWMRDFGLGLPNNPVKFKYSPSYLSRSDARFVDESFRSFLARFKIPITESNLILDGGNVVDNGLDKAVVSDRFFYENQKTSENVLQRELERKLGMKIAVIPDPEDTTGHADGVVAFVDSNVLLIADYCDANYYKLVEDSITQVFPELKTVKLPCYEEKQEKKKGKKASKWRGFSSAIGAYVNILLTDSSVYIPSFNNEKQDNEVLDIVRANTKRRVVSVDTSALSHMGGSVRCMTWQIQTSHPLAMAMLEAARKL